MNENTATIETCPDWCCGGDHESLTEGEVFGAEAEHFALIASGIGWSVELTRFVGGGLPKVTLNHCDSAILANVDKARALGVALIRAADLADRDGCAGRPQQ